MPVRPGESSRAHLLARRRGVQKETSMFTEKKPGAPRVALVGCSASKLKKSAPARELYTSALFRAAYDYAERTCEAVLIVSAFYGVIAPQAVIRPYDRSLRQYNKREREDWGV